MAEETTEEDKTAADTAKDGEDKDEDKGDPEVTGGGDETKDASGGDDAAQTNEEGGEKNEERIRGGGKAVNSGPQSSRNNRRYSPYKAGGGGGEGGGGGGGGDSSADESKNRRVYIGNLSWNVSWQDLKDHMREAGEVARADIMTGPDGRSKGCGIVEYTDEEGAKKAVETLNDTELNGRQIFVREDREERGSGSSGNRFSSDDQAQSRRVYVGNLSWGT